MFRLFSFNYQVDDLQNQLKKEASHCSQLEKLNVELKEELASLKSHSNDQQERNKRQLEEEIVAARRQMESQAEQYQREADERVRQEILQKLEQVNLFLQVEISWIHFVKGNQIKKESKK